MWHLIPVCTTKRPEMTSPGDFFFSSMKDRTRDFETIQHIMRLAKRDRRTQLGMRQGSSLTPTLKGIKLNYLD